MLWRGEVGGGNPSMLRTDLGYSMPLTLSEQNRRSECYETAPPNPVSDLSKKKRTLGAQAFPPLPHLSAYACFPPSLLPSLLFSSLLGWGLLNYHFSILLMCSLLLGGIIILGDD